MFRGTPCITVVLEDQLAGNILTNEVNDQRCRNSCIVNIEVNSWSPLFLNLQINLTHIWHPGKCLKFNQSCRLQKPSNQVRKRNGWTLIGWKGTQSRNPGGLSKKSKVSTVDIEIRKTGLGIYHKSFQLRALSPWCQIYNSNSATLSRQSLKTKVIRKRGKNIKIFLCKKKALKTKSI